MDRDRGAVDTQAALAVDDICSHERRVCFIPRGEGKVERGPEAAEGPTPDG